MPLLQAETFPLNRCGSPHKERMSAHSYVWFGAHPILVRNLTFWKYQIKESGSIGFFEDLSLLHYSNH